MRHSSSGPLSIFNRQAEKFGTTGRERARGIWPITRSTPMCPDEIREIAGASKIMRFGLLAASALIAGLPAFAGEITVEEGFALVSRPNAPAGAIFMVLKNAGDDADTLIGASTSVAERAELHTHIKDGDVIRMREVEGGFDIEAQGARKLERGGDHVMLMGLTQQLDVGSQIEVTLTFEQAGDIVVTLPVKDGASAHGQSDHGHGDDGHGEHSGHDH